MDRNRTVQEHKLPSRRVMPSNWEKENIRARYEDAGITLIPNDKGYSSLLR